MGQRGAAAITAQYSGVQDVIANLVWQNEDGDYGGVPFPVELEVRADPLFVAPELGDYRLQPESPCVDAGDPDPPERIQARDPDGTRLDIGPFPLDQTDFDLLYVVPRSTTVPIGQEALFRLLVANLGDGPREQTVRVELRQSTGALLYHWTRRIRFPDQRSRHREVAVVVPEGLTPGHYVLRAMYGNDVEEVQLLASRAPALPERMVPEY